MAWRVAPRAMARRSDRRVGVPLSKKFTELGIAFIHIPKNAGTSIAFELYGFQVPHLPAWTLRDYYPQQFHVWTKFAVVRDPVDRFLSSTNYLLAGGINKFGVDAGRRIEKEFADLNHFVRSFLDNPDNSMIRDHHYRPQVGYVLDETGSPIVDWLVRYDQLSNGLRLIIPNCSSLPRLNVTQSQRYSRSDLTTDSLETLRYVYRADFELWAKFEQLPLPAAVSADLMFA